MPPTSTVLTPELLAQLERMELVSRKIFRGRMKGERRSPRKGQSVEFADFRNYVPGDDLRFIDWNTYARLDRLFLKLFLEEEDLHFYALIDASASMNFGTPTKLRYAQQLAAALGFIGLIRGDRVKIETLGQRSAGASPVFRGRQSLWRMLEHVEGFAADETVSLAQGVKDFCIRNSGKGIVVHRQGCGNLGDFQRLRHNWLEVEWAQDASVELPTQIRVDVGNQRGGLATVAASIAEMGSNIEKVKSHDRDGMSSTIGFVVKVRDRRHLATIMRRLRGLPSVIGSAPAEALLAVAFLGIGASAIGFVAWAYACARVDVSIAATTLYAVPVVAFMAGWLWLGEQPAAMALAGGAIALAGVALVAGGRASARGQRRARARRSAAQATVR